METGIYITKVEDDVPVEAFIVDAERNNVIYHCFIFPLPMAEQLIAQGASVENITLDLSLN
jgi:hypothetical protein